jgi:hypothetical protein
VHLAHDLDGKDPMRAEFVHLTHESRTNDPCGAQHRLESDHACI